MCDPFPLGVLYTEHTRIKANTPVASLWSCETCLRVYDQAHMINEFRAFAGLSPTVFFSRAKAGTPASVQLRGRPSEWSRQPH